jgi:hypothetical protein
VSLKCTFPIVRRNLAGGLPHALVVLFSENAGYLFTVEILVYVEMVYSVFETGPLFSIHCLVVAPSIDEADAGMAGDDVAARRRME